MTDHGEETATFQLFDAAGVGVAAVDGEGLLLQANGSFLRYLEIDGPDPRGVPFSQFEEAISSPEFWGALAAPGSFRCLVPSRQHLLLTTCRDASGAAEEQAARIILLRPYSLEREFIRMRSRLNGNVVLEISERLSSVAVAGEIILQPDLQEDEATRTRFLSSFFKDINDLGLLFHELQEIAEPIPFPARVRPVPLDWKGLVSDLMAKMRGLANEKNISLDGDFPPRLPEVKGDHQWLTLALYGILNHAVMETSPLEEVLLQCRKGEGFLETSVQYQPADGSETAAWPPQTLFPSPGGHLSGGKLGLSDLALSLGIFHLHRGELLREEGGGAAQLVIRLPA